MTTTDREYAKKLTAYLDDGTVNLKAGTAYSLQLARQAALARLADPRRAPATRMSAALAGASSGTGTAGGPGIRISSKYWVGILVLVAAIFGFQQWQAYQQTTDLADTDAAILSSDLPIDAYLDRGFQNWLTSTTD